jgi:methylenetetrahydrofolate reductase (NADPH)
MKPSISFEYFPPKSPETEALLWDAVADLSALDPKFMTVTYGAGGSTKDKTLEIASRMAASYKDIPIASHLTFLTTTRPELEAYLGDLWARGVRHIVALRGDLPKGKSFADFKGNEYFRLTSEFVAYIKSKHDFEISVAAYPEKHPDAPSLKDDIAALKLKCEAGATRAITQFFFENEKFYDFLDQCAAAGITTPICPGLVPVHDFKSLVRFAANCQAQIPQWLHAKFEPLVDKPEEARKVATELLAEQTLDLAANGVTHIHYYTLNKAPITADACKAISN